MNKGYHSVSVILAVFMFLLVLTGVFAFAFTDLMDDRIYGRKRNIFVVLLALYTIYRGFRLYRLMKPNSGR